MGPTLGLTVAPQKERTRMDEQSTPAEVPLVGHTVEPVVVRLSDSVTIIHGDCRDCLPIEADAVITDPPYGMAHPCNFKSRGRANLAPCNDWQDVHGDREPFDPGWILELGLPTVLWGANWYADKLPPSSGWLVWDKERPDELDQATCELAWTNCIKGVRRFRHLWNGMMRASEHGENYHPTQKPVALFMWTLGLRWLHGVRTVLDPYMGSAPCGVACARLGLNYIGIEIDAGHFETARKRMEAELMQGTFDFGGGAVAPTHNTRITDSGKV
jgi:site-specific DNA-methyltransferase (adenine-specific)